MSELARPATLSLGQVLLDCKLLTADQLRAALSVQSGDSQRKMLGEILIERGLVTQEQLLRALAQAKALEFIEDPRGDADVAVRALVPESIRNEHMVLPMSLSDGTLVVCTSNPDDFVVNERLARITGFRIRVAVSTPERIEAAFAVPMPEVETVAERNGAQTDNLVAEILDNLDHVVGEVTESQTAEMAAGAEEASSGPVVRLVNHIIACAVSEGASDIHIEPDDGHLRVRLRVDGVLHERVKPPYRMHAAIASRIKIMAKLDISERRVPQDGEISVRVSGRPIDLRVSTLPGKFGEKVVMRVIDVGGSRLPLEKLGFRESTAALFKEVIDEPHGVVLVTGPTGSGKSTTLYSVLAGFDTVAINVSTVEDPVESNIPGVHQTQTNVKAGLTFSSALRSLLRQDPDVIMVGEIRDSETAQTAVQAALTGHMVLSTLHTNDAPSAVTRLVNLGVEPFLVAASVRGVLAQRLVRRNCSQCKTAYIPNAADRLSLGKYAASATQLMKGIGCRRCHERGYAGRVGLYELFVPDAQILEAISTNEDLSVIRHLLSERGFETLWDDGMQKVLAGLTTPEEVHGACRR
ncbi:MAG: type II secretion system protein GspE [Phycisphaerales bacterium]|nr:type II secretion system protein GspE [Phycisphaerales bacterium]